MDAETKKNYGDSNLHPVQSNQPFAWLFLYIIYIGEELIYAVYGIKLYQTC